MSNPLISILIANYNNGKYIVETLESAISQTYKNIEIIIVDDCSSDNSLEIVKNYIETHLDYDIRLYKNNHNYGCGRTKRKCVDIAMGAYFAFLDPEDTIRKDAVEILFNEHLSIDNLSIVYSTHYLCNEKLEIQSTATWPGKIPNGKSHLTSKGGHISAFALCSKYFYDETSGIDPKFIVAEDQDLYLKMEEVAPVLYVDKPLYYYRKHDNNISWDESKKTKNAYWSLLARKDAYKRRKSENTISDNLIVREIKREKLLYNLLLFETEYSNSKYYRAFKYLIKSLSSFYVDNKMYIVKRIRKVLVS